ncbi:SulP family inorganic anion transporter [Bartonella sp. HY406]|uniref:SulP family inorganic anion transporter n=1 Tax=Bartonella sp. HY406 TaxID=2979331 RepID=UPI0021CA1576|nr:SulP family inorganic anion transporter [Bartonella sp. HY406]UXN02455.1 SulP family inorganic anion transporter [Bartonella sp. HY406]
MSGQGIDNHKSNADSSKQSSIFWQMFTPKFITVLREGYSFSNFKADALAGLTVAIVALPLSIAIAIASGASPIQGLYTSIIGGFFVSLLGGSRFQIGGPAGAFIVVVATTINEHSMDGLLLAMLMSGVFLAIMGYARLGTYIKFIPYPVTIGFTAGIGVIIFCSQLINILGLELQGGEPGPIIAKMAAIYIAITTFNVQSFALCALTIIIIIVLKKWRPHWPGMLIAIALASFAAFLGALDVATVGSRFGAMPSQLPMPMMPVFSIDKMVEILPAAITFALLGAIESLLSAVVADGMSGRHHRSNCELVGQGFANIITAFFHGICVTGTIARTATNVRAGAHGPMAGIMHAIFILMFIVFAAQLISYIPLAALAGVLAIVSWNMIERGAIKTLFIASKGEAFILTVTFLLTIFWGVAEAIIIGFALGALLFIQRMSSLSKVEMDVPFVGEDSVDGANSTLRPYDDSRLNNEVVIYHISGIFFFGAAANIGSVLDKIADSYKVMILDFSAVPLLDATGAHILESLAQTAKKRQMRLIICGASIALRKEMLAHNIRPPLVEFYSDVVSALETTKSAEE